MQFAERDVRLLGDRGTEQRPLWILQERLRASTVPRRQVLPGAMQTEHLFDERQAHTKHLGDVRDRQFPLLHGGHHSTS